MNPVYVVQKMPWVKKFVIDVVIATGFAVVVTVLFDSADKGFTKVKAKWDAR